MNRLNYFRDEKGFLRCVEGVLPVDNQLFCRRSIEQITNMRVKSPVLAVVVNSPEKEELGEPEIA